MARQFTRQEILDRCADKISKKQAIILCSAGNGLIAKAEDRAGADIIMAYNTGFYRMAGYTAHPGYSPYADSNVESLALARHVVRVVNNTPIVGGVGAHDPYIDPNWLIDEYMRIGLSGITNVPTMGAYLEWEKYYQDCMDIGIGFNAEVNLVKTCVNRGIFTCIYAWTPEQMRAVVAAGADMVGAHVGMTIGGLQGAKAELTMSMDEACERTNYLYEIAKSENPDVMVILHGGPFGNYDTVREGLARTRTVGWIGASSVERIPVETAIPPTIAAYQHLKTGAKC